MGPYTTRDRVKNNIMTKLVPVKVNNIKFSGIGSYGPHGESIGAGHLGAPPLERIVMSFRSGIESEVEYALASLSHLSSTEPALIRFDRLELLGKELIHYFYRPYMFLLDGQESKVTSALIRTSLEALLTLRNAAQDIDNQQWLSQVKSLRKHMVDVLKLFVGWFYTGSIKQSYKISLLNELWREALLYLLDLIDPLTCYYVDNSKQDPLFTQLLHVASRVEDKHHFVAAVKGLTHLLFTSGHAAAEDEKIPQNCIDVVKEEHLEIFVNTLFVNDNEVSLAVLGFIKQYLTSDAVHPNHQDSVKNSQLVRLKKLVQSSGGLNLHTLMKQLPQLIVLNLPLLDATKVEKVPEGTLTKRSAYSGIPSDLPSLPKKLYDVILRFPEPLRATTWLRCCYEPFAYTPVPGLDASTETAPGEVTQISLWKAYELQFEAVWKNESAKSKYPNLLPAVDFIKNVNSAFPDSEAMVINLPTKKKFVIKGIQPRQFAVSIDVGNYDALKKRKATVPYTPNDTNEAKPAGHVDTHSFVHNLNLINDEILAGTAGLTKSDANIINLLSLDILDIIITELLDSDIDGEYKNIFRHYNRSWLPQLIHANPGLVGTYVSSKWLVYLL